MCKIAIIKTITDETRESAWMFIKEMAKQMSKPNCTESDGFGYAAIDGEGNLFGERWLHNADAFKHRNSFGAEEDDEFLKKIKILSKDRVYNSFGQLTDNIKSVTLHSRMSTNEVALKNTHPFVEDFTSVIHNGVISNDEKFTKKTSTCDSEVILHQYIKYNIANKPGKIKKLASKLEGYYALGIFSKTRDGRVILDVVRDSNAKLEAFYIKELKTIVFATPKWTGSPVEDTCKALGFTIKSKYEVKGNRLQRFDVMTGEAIGIESFRSKERTVSHYPTHYNTSPYHNRYSGICERWNPETNRWESTQKRDIFPYADNTVKEEFKQLMAKKDSEADNNVIDMTSHSKAKHQELVKERLLEEMALGNEQYSKEEVERLMKESDDAGKALERFNNDDNLEWYMDDLFVWHKRTMA